MTEMEKKTRGDIRFGKVKAEVLNPKSVYMGELYGEDDPDTNEWTDGLAS
jgi:dynein heavy chain